MEPFKATKLWNKIIQDFRSLMPLKRHRWRMKPYDHCFTTTEAVDWLHEYLQGSSDFGPWVTRHQAVSLLEKFVQSKVIQPVKVSKMSKTRLSASNHQGFEDNGQLYRFVPVSPIKKLRSALTSRSNLRNSPKGASPDLPQKPKPVPKMRPLDDDEPRKTTSSTRTMKTPQTLRTTHPIEATPVFALQAQAEATPVFALQGRTKRGLNPRPLGVNNGGVRGGGLTEMKSSSEVPECRFVARNLTRSETEGVWKSATLMRLQRLLWLSSLEGLLNADVVIPKHIIHNCTHLSRGGVVIVPNKDEDLPHWVLSAMKCLARWPNQTDSSLPAYPGFERDVFRTVFNYFDTLMEPLLTYNLYPLVTEAFIIAEQRERGIAPPGYEEAVLLPDASTIAGIPTFKSVENLMLNMTMGGYEDTVLSPGGYAIPPVATPHGTLDEMNDGRHNLYLESQEGVRERDKPVCRRSVSMIQTTPQIPHNGSGNCPRGHIHPYKSYNNLTRDSYDDRGRGLSTRSVHDYHTKSQSNLYEEENHKNINKMGDISEYYRYREPNTNRRRRPNSARAGFMVTNKFHSESNLHHMEQQGIGYQPRHFGSMTSIGDTDDPIPYIDDDPCSRVIGRSPHVAEPSPIITPSNLNNPSPTSTDGSYHSALGSLPNSANPSPSEPSNQNNQKESAFSRLFRSSKRFGSASDLVQKILRKKSDSSLTSHLSSRNSSTNHTPPTSQCSTHTNSVAPNSKNSSPETETDKISPSYPAPMKAMLSMSQIISSTENSANNTPDAPSFGQKSVSTYNLNQAWQSARTLQDPFHQGLSQSSRNLKSSQPGLLQPGLSQQGLSQARLSQSNRGISAYSLNQTGRSEFGSRLMKRSDSATSLYLNEDQSYMQESLKLCCLLLPPANRRKLHLLLKLMSKIEQNEELQLSRTRSPRNLVLHTFTRCILRCRQEIDLNERLAIRIVEYLMDNHASIFAVPADLKTDVDERLVYLRRGQIKYSPDEMFKDPPTFCQQISAAEFEKQKASTSQQALEGLLDNIIKDSKMASKDKRKKLKQFQKAYPEIYAKCMQTITYGVENMKPSHCQQVTSKEYKTQAVSASEKALEDLLESIIASDKISDRDRKKKLKRFQKMYPDIYRKRLPTTESESRLFPETYRPKIKQPMVNMKKSLTRWKSIR